MAEKKKTTKKTTVAKKKATAKKTASAKKTTTKDKTPTAKQPVKNEVGAIKANKSNYLQTVGRRKKAIAQVRLFKSGKGQITVNDKPFHDYFTILELRNAVKEPLLAAGLADKVDLSIKAYGGGVRGQAEATRLGIARALVLMNPDIKTTLKKQSLLTRDPRKKERKKPGLKGARRAPQWSKR